MNIERTVNDRDDRFAGEDIAMNIFGIICKHGVHPVDSHVDLLQRRSDLDNQNIGAGGRFI